MGRAEMDQILVNSVCLGSLWWWVGCAAEYVREWGPVIGLSFVWGRCAADRC